MKDARAVERQSGFSLIELMVALMAMTIVMGAVYGLIAASDSAFKRDPQISERQQNLRVSMDLVQKDVAIAGAAMGTYMQAFGTGLDGFGPPGATTAGVDTDHLLITGSDGACAEWPAVPHAGSCQLDFPTGPAPSCYKDDSFVLVMFGNPPSGGKMGWAHLYHSGDQRVNFPPGLQLPLSLITQNQDLTTPTNATAIGNAAYIRWAVWPDPEDNVPALWRSDRGGLDGGGAYVGPSAGPAAGWQLVARGIDDFQVQYRHVGENTWDDDPGVPVDGTLATIVQEVRVTVWSRTTLEIGGVTDAQGRHANRGQLTSVSTPRAVLGNLAAINQWR